MSGVVYWFKTRKLGNTIDNKKPTALGGFDGHLREPDYCITSASADPELRLLFLGTRIFSLG